MGRVDVEQMLGEITLREWRRWLDYAEVEPFGEQRADLRTGILAALIANVNAKKGSRPYRPRDFMPDFRPRRQSWQQMRQSFMAGAKLHNAATAANRKGR